MTSIWLQMTLVDSQHDMCVKQLADCIYHCGNKEWMCYTALMSHWDIEHNTKTIYQYKLTDKKGCLLFTLLYCKNNTENKKTGYDLNLKIIPYIPWNQLFVMWLWQMVSTVYSKVQLNLIWRFSRVFCLAVVLCPITKTILLLSIWYSFIVFKSFSSCQSWPEQVLRHVLTLTRALIKVR